MTTSSRSAVPLDTMTSGRWRRIEAAFYGALEQPHVARQNYLDEACGDDLELRQEVEALLAAEGDSARVDGLVAQGAALAGRKLSGSQEFRSFQELDQDDGPGPERIGPYRILKEIGRGGLGTVYLAQRDDEHYAMRVAIKLVRRGLDTDDILDRLRQERQILARLEHPHITRLLDGGSTESGQPYLVMEYVDGLALDTFCDRHGLPLEERLRLLLDICSAVAVAHRNLVIHRDIKPSNVLVTEGGTVKLLDFGIAKLLDGDTIVEPTTPERRWLTPEYASPEQISGGSLTTATDIYSLGVMLFRLLTGLPPQHQGTKPPALDHREPPRPSERFADAPLSAQATLAQQRGCGTRSRAAKRLRQQLRGDLDTIVLKAMATEASERYGSVAELADDLRRTLESRPIRARPTPVIMRWRKFIHRNRLAVVAALLVASSLIVGIASTLWQARIARQAQQVAEQQQGRAETNEAFLFELFETSNPNVAKGEELTVRQFFEEGSRRIDRLHDQPETQAQLMQIIGRIHLSLGHYEEAMTFHQDAMQLRRRLLPPDHPDIAESLVALGEVHIAQGTPNIAEKLLRRALNIRQQHYGLEDVKVAEALNDLGVALRHQRRWNEAQELLGQAIELRQRLLGERDIDTARSLNNLAVVYSKLEDLDRAETLLRRALAIRRQMFGEDHSETLTASYNLAVVLRRQGKLEASEAALRDLLALRRKSLGEDHADVAAGLNSLARTLELQGKLDEAVPIYQQSVAIYRRALGDNNRKAALVLNNLADALKRMEQLGEAMATYRNALTMQQRLQGQHPETARALEGITALHLLADTPLPAIATARQAMELRRQIHPLSGPNGWRVAAAEGLLGRSLLANGRQADAEPLLLNAIEILSERFGTDHALTLQFREPLEAARPRSAVAQ